MGNTAQKASPWDLDLDRFVKKVLQDQAQYFPDEATAKNALDEYRRFLRMHQKYPEYWLRGSKLVDIVWHEHIIDTKQYMIDCDRLFGHYLHHYPDFGQVGAFLHEEDMLKAYMEEFGESPREDIWPLDLAANATTSRRLGACGYRPPPTRRRRTRRRRWTPYPTYPPTPRPTYRPTPTPTYAPTPRPTYAPTPRPTYAPTPAPYAPTPRPTYPPRRRTPTPTYPPRLRTPAPTHQPPSIYGDLTKPK